MHLMIFVIIMLHVILGVSLFHLFFSLLVQDSNLSLCFVIFSINSIPQSDTQFFRFTNRILFGH